MRKFTLCSIIVGTITMANIACAATCTLTNNSQSQRLVKIEYSDCRPEEVHLGPIGSSYPRAQEINKNNCCIIKATVTEITGDRKGQVWEKNFRPCISPVTSPDSPVAPEHINLIVSKKSILVEYEVAAIRK